MLQEKKKKIGTASDKVKINFRSMGRSYSTSKEPHEIKPRETTNTGRKLDGREKVIYTKRQRKKKKKSSRD